MDFIEIIIKIQTEIDYGLAEYGPFKNAYEGYAVMLKEVDELWDEIKKNAKKFPGRNADIQKEAIQVAAMAIRIALENK